jgi:hypothetical protein
VSEVLVSALEAKDTGQGSRVVLTLLGVVPTAVE